MKEPWRNHDGSINWQHPDVPEEEFKAEVVPFSELVGYEKPDRIEYALVPQEVWSSFRPPERLLLALHYAYRAWSPEEGGWFRLSMSLYGRAGLKSRQVRWKAVNTLFSRGVIEVKREGTRTTRVRLKKPGPKRVQNGKPK